MKGKPTSPPAATQLRRHAESRLRKRPGHSPSRTGGPRSAADSQRLLHELQVHQIELQMQNDELKQTRDKMEEGLEKYCSLYDFAPVGYLTLDREGIIGEVNLAGAGLLGVNRAALMHQRIRAFVLPADRPLFDHFLRHVFAHTTNAEGEMRLARAGKPPVDVRMRASRAGGGQSCQVALTDITGQREAANKVRVSEIRFRRLFETAHDGILLLDPHTRKITDANPLMTKLLGYPRDQLVGKELFEIGLLKDEGASQVMFQKLTRKHEVRYEDLPLESQDGRHQEVEVVANLYQEDGHSVIQCNIRDITARKQIEAALRVAQLQLARHAGQLENQVTRRTAQLLASNQELAVALDSTRLGAEQNRVLLVEAQLMHKKLRHLTHQILTAQEEERKKISRELHDDVVQTLVGINVELSALVHGNSAGVRQLKDKITRTQRLVEKSVDSVHRFARELRPTVLDDLGLIPALHAYCVSLAARKTLKIKLTAFGGVEALESDKRTVLFRVVQEALTNVARHAHATQAQVVISKIPDAIRLEIRDNGKSFEVKKTLQTRHNKRLGLVGMRERIEMVGGNLVIESLSGKGTTVRAEIPFNHANHIK
ncbi:MAG: PAS domain S-box protein [Lacunisphaera sp.]|nr:PAS domain S-box protein [Lacunisphaera sp.]